MYHALKQKICGGSDEMDPTGFDQYKYSRASSKSRRTVICRISVHQKVNKKDENQSEINEDKTDNDHELTNISSVTQKNEIINTTTQL